MIQVLQFFVDYEAIKGELKRRHYSNSIGSKKKNVGCSFESFIDFCTHHSLGVTLSFPLTLAFFDSAENREKKNPAFLIYFRELELQEELPPSSEEELRFSMWACVLVSNIVLHFEQ